MFIYTLKKVHVLDITHHFLHLSRVFGGLRGINAEDFLVS